MFLSWEESKYSLDDHSESHSGYRHCYKRNQSNSIWNFNLSSYSLPGTPGKNPTRACALVHAPPSMVLRRKPRDRNKVRLTEGPQALLALGSGERQLLPPPPSWTRPPCQRRGCDLAAPARNCGKERLRRTTANGASASEHQQPWQDLLPPAGAGAPGWAYGNHYPIP